MTRARASFAGLVASEEQRATRMGVSEADIREAEALASERGWLDPEGGDNWPLMFISFGLAALRREREAAGGRAARPASEARLAALRFAASDLATTNRLLRIRENALKIDNRGMRLRLGDEAP